MTKHTHNRPWSTSRASPASSPTRAGAPSSSAWAAPASSPSRGWPPSSVGMRYVWVTWGCGMDVGSVDERTVVAQNVRWVSNVAYPLPYPGTTYTYTEPAHKCIHPDHKPNQIGHNLSIYPDHTHIHIYIPDTRCGSWPSRRGSRWRTCGRRSRR